MLLYALNNLIGFHPDKTIEDWNDPVQLTTYQVHGLPDLNQSNPEVYSYLLNSSKKWLQMPSVMGLRVDAIRHMDNTFLQQINADLEQDNAWLLGRFSRKSHFQHRSIQADRHRSSI